MGSRSSGQLTRQEKRVKSGRGIRGKRVIGSSGRQRDLSLSFLVAVAEQARPVARFCADLRTKLVTPKIFLVVDPERPSSQISASSPGSYCCDTKHLVTTLLRKCEEPNTFDSAINSRSHNMLSGCILNI